MTTSQQSPSVRWPTVRRRRLRLAAFGAVLAVAVGAVVATVLPAEAAVAPVAGGVYTLVPGASGKCVNVTGASTANCALLVQAACVAGTSQQWRAVGRGRPVHPGQRQQRPLHRRAQPVDHLRASAAAVGLRRRHQDQPAVDVHRLHRGGRQVPGQERRHRPVPERPRTAPPRATTRSSQETCSDISRMQWSFNLVSADRAPTTAPTDGTGPPTNPAAASGQADGGPQPRLISVRSGSGEPGVLAAARHRGRDTGFNVYRGGTKVNASPITASTNYLDAGAAAGAAYTVRAVVNGVEQAARRPRCSFANGYLDVPISDPAGGTTPDGVAYTYSANDASVGDLDGDGQYEIVLKWDPSNAKDNSQSGYTGNVYVDAYRLNGTRLWRIDLGRNIRAGAHYTQFQVYDYDGDGRAEVAMKTADGTVSGTGQVIGNVQRRLPQLHRLRPDRPGVPDHVQRPDRRGACPP